MIFKTYENDLDGISNKLGFSKRSFAEWGTQIKTSFSEGTTYIEKFKNTLQAMFISQSSKNDDSWLRTNAGDIVSKDNIDSYIPEFDTDSARVELEFLQSIQNKINETKGSWDDYNDNFTYGKKYLLDYAKSNNVLEASVDNVKEANQKAREAALAHNAALKQQTLASKAAAVGMKVFSTALNMAAFALIAKGIELVVTRISDLKNASKEITENAKSYSSELTDLQSEHSKNISTISSLSKEYENLSQGVNILGENISLTSDEYDRYHDICNQIADIMPNLVSGYDEQGNAIINLKNNLSDLNKEYENKMLLEAEQAYNEKDEDDNYKRDSIVKDFDNFKELDTSVELRDTGTTAEDYYSKLKDIVTKSKEELSEIYSDDFTEMDDLITQQILRDYGNFADMTDKEFESVRNTMLEDIDKLSNSLSTRSAQVSQIMMQYAKSTSSYYDNLDENDKSYFSNIINNLDYDFIKDNNLNNEENYEDFVDNIINVFKSGNGEIQQAFENMLEVDTSTTSLMEAKGDIEESATEIANILSKANPGIDFSKEDIINNLGLSETIEDAKRLENSISSFGEKSYNKLSQYTKDFKSSQVDAWIEATRGAKNATQAIAQYENANRGALLDIGTMSADIQNFTTAHEALNTAISEQNKNGTISNETLKKLSENYENIDSAIELTTNGIRLNSTELAKLNAEKKSAIKTELAEKEQELTDAYNKGSVELATYQETLAHCTDVKSDDYQALSNLIEQKQADQEATLGQIGELENLSLEYENAISKHNAFLNALSSEDAGAGYDAITSGLKQVEEAWSNGDFGKDEIRTLVDYMSYDDMSTASIADIKNAYEDAINSAHKYFTETTEGQENFLQLLKETKVNNEALASVDGEGNWSINIKNMEEAAQACGFSVDFLSDNLKKLEEKGFEGAFTDNNDLVDTSARIQELDDQIAQLQTRLHNGDKTEGLQEELEKLKNTRAEISVELDQSKVKKAIDDILYLQTQIENLSNSGGSSSAIIEMQNKQKSIASQNGIDLNSVLNVDTNDAQSKWEVFKETIEKSDLKTDVTVSADTNPFKTAINTITNGTYTAKIGLQVTASGVVSKVKEVIKNAVSNASGDAGAYGSANITGHSYADGNLGVKKDQKNVMVSEIQPEMVVDPHSGNYTIYKYPTMLDKLPKDAIVFNGKQTEEILKNGMATSFGRAYSKGYNSSGSLTGSSPSSTKKASSKKKDSKTTKTLIDWIERRINVLTTKAERWANIIENATNPKRLDSYYKKLESNYKKQVKTYSSGAARYLQKANSIKLSSGLKNKVKSKDSSIFNKDGSMKSYKTLIKEYGEKTAKKIQDYQNWYIKCHIA